MRNNSTIHHCASVFMGPSEISTPLLLARLNIILVFAILVGIASVANAADPAGELVKPYTPGSAILMPPQTTQDCSNLLAVRLSLMEGALTPPLNNCSEQVFIESPPLSAFDCLGMTANECAALYQSHLPHHYMNDGWNPDNELWYMPIVNEDGGDNLCADGTNQFVYVDKAVSWQCSNNASQCLTDDDCGVGFCQMNDIESNDWVFYTQGGSNCTSGQDCLTRYLRGEGHMSSANAPFSFDGAGILSNRADNPFHQHNRVRLKKCTKDAFMGNTTRPINADEPRPNGVWERTHHEFDLHFHGYRQWLATFEKLGDTPNPHLEYAGSCLDDGDCDLGGQCVPNFGEEPVNMCRYAKNLPALSNAESVLIVGWSGGSNALSQTGDHLVEYLQTGAQPLAPNAVVSLAFDAPWKPGLESDTAFDIGHRNMYQVNDADIPTANNPATLPDDADATDENGFDAKFSNETFLPGGSTFTANRYWQVPLDTSCVAAHGINSWHCHERNHILANHITSPVFTRMAQRDSSGKDKPGSNHMHSFEQCLLEESEMNCYDWVDEEYRQRSFQQSADFYRNFLNQSEEGASAPNPGVFSTDNTKHNGLEDQHQFIDVELVQCRVDGVEIRSHTLASSLVTWLHTGNRIGAVERREGVVAGQGYLWVARDACAACPQLSGVQAFSDDDDLSEWDLSACTY